ncbi:hypothetical protein ACFVOR_16385 [Streptomyces sp. NPDC057837]
MPGFRAVVDPDELIANTPPEVLEPHRTAYDDERGGHYPEDEE